MEQLRSFLNSLSVEDQTCFAKKCGTTIGYLRKSLSTKPKFDGALCRKLDKHSNGAVPQESLRPDIFS